MALPKHDATEADVLRDVDLKHDELARSVEDMRRDLRDIARAVAVLSRRIDMAASKATPVTPAARGFDQLKLLVVGNGGPDAA